MVQIDISDESGVFISPSSLLACNDDAFMKSKPKHHYECIPSQFIVKKYEGHDFRYPPFRVEYENDTSLKGLAQASAATQIQAFWRGSFNRTKRWTKERKYDKIQDTKKSSVDFPIISSSKSLGNDSRRVYSPVTSPKNNIHVAATLIQRRWKIFMRLTHVKNKFNRSDSLYYDENKLQNNVDSIDSNGVNPNVSDQTSVPTKVQQDINGNKCIGTLGSSTEKVGQQPINTVDNVQENKSHGTIQKPATQVEFPDGVSLQTPRRDVVSKGYEVSFRKSLKAKIKLKGSEILKILKALDVLEVKEYNIMMDHYLTNTNPIDDNSNAPQKMHIKQKSRYYERNSLSSYKNTDAGKVERHRDDDLDLLILRNS